jgi:hypothetical protein
LTERICPTMSQGKRHSVQMALLYWLNFPDRTECERVSVNAGTSPCCGLLGDTRDQGYSTGAELNVHPVVTRCFATLVDGRKMPESQYRE